MSNPKISEIQIYQSPIKLKEPFIISLGKLTHAENIIVRIKTNNGLEGLGEASPFMTINGENMQTAFIVGSILAKNLVGANPIDIENCHQIMDKIIYANTSIKSAFDIALYDIASQNANLPLYKYLGGDNNKILTTDYTVSIAEPEKMAKDALKIVENGFQIIKVKLGQTTKLDVERIKAIREVVGISIPIRIDANQGWSLETAIETLNELAKFNIQHCEEPIPRWDFMNLPKLKQISPIPIMADETCCDHHDAQRLVDINACNLFNIKLGKSSGIFNALKIIDIANKNDIDIQIGGFLESRLAFTASAHLALVSDLVKHCDFDTPLMFIEDPIIDGIKYKNNGEIILPELIGLGAKVEENYLNSLISIKIN